MPDNVELIGLIVAIVIGVIVFIASVIYLPSFPKPFGPARWVVCGLLGVIPVALYIGFVIKK